LKNEEKKFKRIYGNKGVSKMKKEFKRDVTDVTLALNKKLISQYEEAKALLEKTIKSLEIIKNDIWEKIPHQEHDLWI